MSNTTAKKTILRTRNLRKSFGGIHAVQDLNVTVDEGEVIAIIGPNGSGKTTFFNLVMQLYDVTSGEILFGPDEIDLVGMRTHEINRLGVARTFQNLRLFHDPRERIDRHEPTYLRRVLVNGLPA